MWLLLLIAATLKRALNTARNQLPRRASLSSLDIPAVLHRCLHKAAARHGRYPTLPSPLTWHKQPLPPGTRPGFVPKGLSNQCPWA